MRDARDSDAADGCKWLLDSLAKSSPPGPSVPSSEPAGLSHLVYYQIEYLKNRRSAWYTTESVQHSIDAVLRAYRAGELQAVPGLVSYWWNGNMVRGPGPHWLDNLAECAEEWKARYGKGQVHIERLGKTYTQQASVAVYPAAGQPYNPEPVPALSNHLVS